jgi:formylglycine-generating enzyme required for sulfatase activity/class 3 adenylate cyclase
VRDLPEGLLTMLFTDIEGSTELVKRLGPAFPALLDRHHRLIREALALQGGHEVRTMGDAFFCVFVDAQAGLATAAEAQRRLQAHPWPAGASIQVRMGLHTGQIARFDQDYAGMEIHRAARISGTGQGGQIVVSQTTVDALAGRLPEGVALIDQGDHWLKDLSAPERLWLARIEGLPEANRPLQSLGKPQLRLSLHADAAESALREPATILADLRQAMADGVSDFGLSEAEQRMLLRLDPEDLDAYRLSRLAEWSAPRYRVDSRFVNLSLMLDQGEQAAGERWRVDPKHHEDLGELLQTGEHRALVILGPPGSGKSTLLRQLELSLAARTLAEAGGAEVGRSGRAEDGTADEKPEGSEPRGSETVSFFVPLNSYGAESAAPTDPASWLAARWQARYPRLPALESFIDQGRLLLLLDGLNEMPHADEAGYQAQVAAWRSFLIELQARRPGNRVVFSCRNLDYSASLSSPQLRVPQVRVEALDDLQVQRFLGLYAPASVDRIWPALVGSPALEILRRPFFLKMLVEQVAETGELPTGRVGIFTGFVRRALAREIEQGNPRFRAGALLTSRDCRRLAQASGWRDPAELPERGPLLPGLADLAYGMQSAAGAGENRQVRVDFDAALDLLDHPEGEEILRAGADLSVLDEDLERDEILFAHQLFQEYFAARRLLRGGDPQLAASPWRSEDMQPPLATVLATLDPADRLPAAPGTGWEESLILAAVMQAEPEAFLAGLFEANLALCGRAAAEAELAGRLSEGFVDRLREALVQRSADPEADLRARLAAAEALGPLGDPRYHRVESGAGAFLLPPMVQLAGSEGRDAGKGVKTLEIGRFPVTNAEWSLFMADGGYDEPAWWQGPAAESWRRGEGVMEGQKQDWRQWRQRFVDEPEQLESMSRQGALSAEQVAEWRRFAAMDAAALEIVLEQRFPARRLLTPGRWGEPGFRQALQPVVGVSWHEARAYCAWLSARSGQVFRLPEEAEWETAAGVGEGRDFAWGDGFDPGRANLAGSHLQGPSPVGIFPAGRTPSGLDDISGNCFEWTLGQPSAPAAGQAEMASGSETGAGSLRIARGGSWADGEVTARLDYPYSLHPSLRHITVGFRMVREPNGNEPTED